MRQFLIVVLVLFSFISWNVPANNPLKNTQWAGKVNIPDPADGIFAFTADTVNLYVGGSMIESSVYKLSGDTLKLIKASGMSSCGNDTGYYKFSIKDSTLTIMPRRDYCTDRSGAFSADGYKSTHSSF